MSSSVFDSNNLSTPLVPEHHQSSNGNSHHRSSYIDALPAPAKALPRQLLQWLNIGTNTNVSGYAVSGEVFAFLGSEHKTCILEVLATEDRNQSMCAFLGLPEFSSEAVKQSKVDSEKVLFNGRPHRPPAPVVAFLRHDYLQCLYNELTVLDYLQFTDSISHSTMSISQVISLLQLEALLQSPIGSLSDMQRFCVLIGQELLRDAQIFLLEDPLMSLDNDAAASLMHVLRSISREANRIVVLSLSSFSNTTLNCIDRTQIISPEGSLYFGPTSRLEAYLSAAGYECSAKASVADLLNTLLAACKKANALEIEMRKISPVSSRLSSHQDLDSMRQSEDTVGARSTTGGLSDVGLSASQISYAANTADSKDITVIATLLCFCRQIWWLLWRAFAVRIRNLDLLLNTWFLGGVMVGLAVSFTFYNVKNDMNGFQNRCAFLSVYPFGVVLVCNMWFDSDVKDWKVFCYERKRSAYVPLLFPCANIIADIITLRIIPAIMATAIMYDLVGLNDDTDVRKTFYLTFILMIVTGTMLARFFCFLMTSLIYNMAPIKAALQSAAVYCLLILYAGFLLNLDTLPPSKYFVRDWSFFYWVIQTVYFLYNSLY